MFELLTPVTAKVASFNIRNEKHGDDDVLAFSMGLKITTSNTFLDLIVPGLRDSLYKAIEGQDQLPGVEPSTPLLRCKKIDRVELGLSFEGWTFAVQHGIDENTPITVGGTKVDKWRVKPLDGGSSEVTLRVGSNDVDETELGKLGGKLGQEIQFTLSAPKPMEPAIDGSASGGGPGFKAEGETEPDAGDLFTAAHGTDPDDDDPDSEGGETDAEPEPHTDLPRTVKYRSPQTGETWSGRGRKPAWLEKALATGQRLEDFLVERVAA